MESLSSVRERALNPFPWYRMMRESAPVYYNPERNSWNVFRYDDVQRVLADYTVFSSEPRHIPAAQRQPIGASIINTDPPRHHKLRSLVSQAFTPRRVAQLEPRITAIVHELLDQVTPMGRMDVIDDLAYPLPVTVIAELLGIPIGDRERFKRWSDAVVGGSPMDRRMAQMEMGEYFLSIIERRRHEAENDLISGLMQARIEGQQLSLVELLGFCILLLVAGNETTTNLIGNAMLCFSERPEVMEQLRADPSLLPDAIEEVLRYRSPVQVMFRHTIADTHLGDQEIRAGQGVLAWIGSANRDESQFADPDRFDIHRMPNRHLAFGNGIHFCLGAPLARLEARIALAIMIERLPGLRIAPDVQLEPQESFIVYGVKHLPVIFAAGRA